MNRTCYQCKDTFDTDTEGSWILCGKCDSDRAVNSIKKSIQVLSDIIKIAPAEMRGQATMELINRSKELEEHNAASF